MSKLTLMVLILAAIAGFVGGGAVFGLAAYLMTEHNAQLKTSERQ